MSPLPGYQLIPRAWSSHHRPMIAGTANADCQIERPAGPAPYPRPEDWVASTVLWAGRVRLQQLNRDGAPLMGEQPTQVRRYLLVIPMQEANPLPQLRVGENGDVAVVGGKQYQFTQHLDGSELWEHDFIVTLNTTQEGANV